MPPRPALQVKGDRRSAIYLGKTANFSPNLQDLTQSPQFSSTYPSLIEGTPPSLPDLPEPPSPSSSVGSSKSGLPSPPATNSTGSGSTGDPATIGFRGRPLSLHSNSSASTSSGSHHTVPATPMQRASSSRNEHVQEDTGAEGDFDDDYDNDNDSNLDGDDTARLDRRLLGGGNSSKSSSENVLALQRVRSLAQRNRMVLDKLSSRLGSPSPARSNTPNHSPAPSHASLASSRLSQPPRQLRADPGRSGSETERESTHNSHSSSSHKHSASMDSYSSFTPPPAKPSHLPENRLRHLSAPGSPQKARLVATGSTHTSVSSSSNSSHSPTRRRRQHASMASISQLQLTDFSEEENEDPGQKTTTGTARDRRDRTLNERDMITQSALAAVASSRRSPLGNRRRSALPKEFRSDLAEDSQSLRYDTHRETERWKHAVEPLTPFRPGGGRSATVRETRRRTFSPRWASDDHRAAATVRERNDDTTGQIVVIKERRQSFRGGSVESALPWSPGGRLAGESLRAAGLSPRKGLPSARDLFHDKPADRVLTERERDKQPARASTSMAHYQYLDSGVVDSPREAKSNVYPLTTTTRDLSTPKRDHLDRPSSSFSRHTPVSPAPHAATTAAHLKDRLTAGSPFGSRRYTTQSPQNQSEHTRLLFDSLAMFETQLAKLPQTGLVSSHADLARNAHGVVHSTERLAAMLKSAGTRAMEAQVEAEVESSTTSDNNANLVEIYGKVASDYRENARTADELVRGVTALLLGVGKVVRDFGVQNDFGSPSVHGRQLSLGGDVLAENGSASSGRHSVASRRSWDPREREREDALRRLTGVPRPESVLARASPSTFQKLREREQLETPNVPTGSVRRLFTPREQREQLLDANSPAAGMTSLNSQETLHPQRHEYEPSPTPASKNRPSTSTVARTLTPLSIPKPLPILPSEALVRRQPANPANNPENKPSSTRRRSTMRGTMDKPTFPAITTPSNATTQVTPHTVSNSPHTRTSFPLLRTDSNKSTRSQVTFSRPTKVSVEETLTDLQHLDSERKRTEPNTSSVPPSSSETEREVKRKTLVGSRAGVQQVQVEKGREGSLVKRDSTAHAADRSAATTILQQANRRERRRTVTDIWPRD